MSRRRRWLLAAAILIAIGAVSFLVQTPRTPEGQPPLVELSSETFQRFKQEFNRESDRVRVVLLLAPT